METETYSPQKPFTSRGVQSPLNVTKMCKLMHKVHLRKQAQVATPQLQMCHWHFGSRGKEFLLRTCQNFMMKMAWHIRVTTFHHCQKSVQESNYNLLIIYIKYMQITKIIHQNELTYTLKFFNLYKKKIFKSICYIVYPNKLTC